MAVSICNLDGAAADSRQNSWYAELNMTELEKSVSILGVPLGYGASMAGVDIGPAALRVARFNQRIARLGYAVRDLGDMRLERPQTFPEEGEKLKYVREISNACEQLAAKLKRYSPPVNFL